MMMIFENTVSKTRSEKESKMKIVTLIARLLLGLIFVVFGLNGFLNFLSMGPMPSGLAGQFFGALLLLHYFLGVASLLLHHKPPLLTQLLRCSHNPANL